MPMRADADARFWLHIPGYGDRLRPGLRVLFNVRTNEGRLSSTSCTARGLASRAARPESASGRRGHQRRPLSAGRSPHYGEMAR